MIKLLWRSLHISHRCTALQTAFWQVSEYQELCKDVRTTPWCFRSHQTAGCKDKWGRLTSRPAVIEAGDRSIRCTSCICAAVAVQDADGAVSQGSTFFLPGLWSFSLTQIFHSCPSWSSLPPSVFSRCDFVLPLFNSLWHLFLYLISFFIYLSLTPSDLNIATLITLPLGLVSMNATHVTLSCFDMFSL